MPGIVEFKPQLDEDQLIERNDHRIESIQRRINRFTERQDRIREKSAQLAAAKTARLKKEDTEKEPKQPVI